MAYHEMGKVKDLKKTFSAGEKLTTVPVVYLAVVLCLTIFTLNSSAEDRNETATKPNWQQLDKALALAKASGKYIIINFYTDWCPNCKRMDERTYRDNEVLEQLQEAFISVKLNAESSRPLIIEGQAISEERIALMFRVNSYPTTWFLSSEGRPLMPLRGYYGPKIFAPVLRFVEGGWYEKMDFEMYMEREKQR